MKFEKGKVFVASELVDYVEKKDLEGFRTLMAHHIDDSRQMCLKALKEQFKEQNRA